MDMKEISSGPVDSKPPSIYDLQSEDLVSSADELVFKVRKPYTIKKQRERWTEEEHEKFLEALKLYGRAWRRIQEHIGTKTAVQIRSHAQKFFSKVVREQDIEKTIEIPPPRPKRKPLHPYPRKSSHKFTKKCPALETQKSSLSEEDNRSPVSVLSAAGSDIVGSPTSDRPNSCTSIDTDEDHSSAAGLATAALTEQYAIPMELDSMSCGNNSRMEISPSEGQSTGIKLFGQTVFLPESQKNCSSRTGDPECSSGCGTGSHKNSTKTTASSATSEQCFKLACEDSSGSPNGNAWNSWQGGMPTMYYYLNPNSYPSSNPMAAFAPHPLWWTFCSNLSLPLANQQNETSKGGLPSGYKGALDGDNAEKESSSTESSSVCETRAVINKNIPKVAVNINSHELPNYSALNFKLTPSENSAFTRVTVSNNKSTRGFVPYKRCAEGHQAQQYILTNTDKEAQAVGLCL